MEVCVCTSVLLLAMHVDQRLAQIMQEPLVHQLWPCRPQKNQKHLNREQARSVDMCLRSKFQLIQGPPGNDNAPTHMYIPYTLIQIC